ncbi:ATP-grasp domain-containing protein [Dactylosporangium aurantiacum]|uniref:ATP-grasp domain-containing protein n=1 Tax=Dactylosporangium aurantiacum TaxID=35754 RepID=A0A9Q9IBR7_9ACTN|nr:ATP-grasp domain-containing protein [Dactylosporangium aurantiacum]MDG6106421.1 ATP-grasp domain-containing protein [Dactylosporangium aurantiacum]UWZ50539.1 ATP-grasp domain-containing protein [Dactylosporangium aurantiacum]
MMLILGASEDQLPVYLEARRRGIPTIGVDVRRDRPAYPYADVWLPVSIKDHEGIVAALDGRRPTAVVAAASEAGLWSWHELSRRYELPYRFPAGAARASLDKSEFHRIVRATGVPGYRWHEGGDRAALTRAAHDIGFPVVVKPPDTSGSKGISFVEDPADLPAALDYAARFTTPGGPLLVEEFLAGRNLTVDVFMRAGQVAFAGITEKRLVPGPRFVIGGHTGPAAVAAAVRDRLVLAAGRLCRAIDLTDGPANFDVILRADGSFAVLEANARLCGNAFPLLMRHMYGVDTVAALVSLALGEPFDLTPSRDDAGIIHVLASPLPGDAVLTAVDGVARARALPGVVCCEVYAEPGAVVRPFDQSANKIGYLVVTGPDTATAQARLAAALDVLVLRFAPAPAEPAAEPAGVSLPG